MTTRTILAPMVTLALLAGAAQAEPQTPAYLDVPAWMTETRDWSATLEQDARALHAIVIDSHPGVHDALNPQFRARVDAGLAQALERARATTDAADTGGPCGPSPPRFRTAIWPSP